MQKNKRPFFSIITVTRNSEKYIERNIKSLTNQSFKNFEHIIIDGDSKDKTLQIIKKHRKNVDYFISKKDRNMWHAINRGMSEKVNYISNMYYQSKVRIKNKQNIFYVIFLSILTTIYKYLLKIFRFKKS